MHLVFKQECIPVGCVPSATVTISLGCLPGGGCLPARRGVCLPGGCWSGGCLPAGGGPGRGCGQTDTCENITFPQLLLWTVIIDKLRCSFQKRDEITQNCNFVFRLQGYQTMPHLSVRSAGHTCKFSGTRKNNP